MVESTARFTTRLDADHDVLVTVGDPGPIHRDLELHLLSIGVREDPLSLGLLEDALSAMALYMVSRPKFDSFGWTIHLEDPLLNIFVAGSAEERFVVGRTFHEGIERSETNLFFAQTSRPRTALQTSSTPVEGRDVFGIVEQYCAQSDQQPVRLFRRGGTVALVGALPDASRPWLAGLTADDALRLGGLEEHKLISEREVEFRCGCDLDRAARMVAELYRDDPEDLFRGDPEVEVHCPRCATRHRIPRAMFDAKLRG